ncbi:hypothetical protein LEP1GSC173_3054 [Leptospira interrogans str. HAI1594]|nr:hypothetical protein LEP1GSC117_1567 [Leptospira interrogans serovar Icterohaemorrhagiae str. Verdun LP]EKP77816.1 hypothetical protein LEP1GSC173_3054 [Leptospira interrogans str. HAI1594]EMO18653.1 hypothetical protein LEP1GSC167_1655 [Leptospira interrogans serovar Copenhageni str. HAI0188]EMO35470.1 hypothetical protein LEP1GSC177_4132 [Leptospira interrogans str. MMD3731]
MRTVCFNSEDLGSCLKPEQKTVLNFFVKRGSSHKNRLF